MGLNAKDNNWGSLVIRGIYLFRLDSNFYFARYINSYYTF